MQIGPNLSTTPTLMGISSQTAVQPIKESAQVNEQSLKQQSSQEQPTKVPDINGKGGKLNLSA